MDSVGDPNGESTLLPFHYLPLNCPYVCHKEALPNEIEDEWKEGEVIVRSRIHKGKERVCND